MAFVPKLVISDEILTPSGEIMVKFKGKNPFTVMAIAPTVLRDVMKISAKDLFEQEVKWDTTADPRSFFGRWRGKRGEDRWTRTEIKIIIQGEQHSTEKTGYAEIRLKGNVITEYKYANFLQKAFWFFYNRGFYYRQRQKYIEFAKDNIYELKEIFQKSLGIYNE